jgi:hypothetical protein
VVEDEENPLAHIEKKQSSHHHDHDEHDDHHHHHGHRATVKMLSRDDPIFYRSVRLRTNDASVFNYYRMSKMLGAGKYPYSNCCLGTFGEVWNCVQRETGAHRAVKVIKRNMYSQR